MLAMYLVILGSGILQAFGNPMNAQLNESLHNSWLATFVSFLLIAPIFLLLFALLPKPLPDAAGIEAMPWWAPFGGIVGSVAVAVGLVFTSRVGAGAMAGLLITANLATSVLIDHFGWFHMEQHKAGLGRILGVVAMAGGVAAISFF